MKEVLIKRINNAVLSKKLEIALMVEFNKVILLETKFYSNNVASFAYTLTIRVIL